MSRVYLAKQTGLDQAELNNSVIGGAGVPTSSTAAYVEGQFYKNTSNGEMYQCTAIIEASGAKTYTWKKVITSEDSLDPASVYKFATSTSTSGYENISNIDHRYLVIDVGDNNIIKYWDIATSEWKPIVPAWQ